MSIMKRQKRSSDLSVEHELYEWVANLPPQATVHVREGSAYIGSFPAYEIQEGDPVEEYLMSRYGAGTYELSGHSQGVFLAGRQTVLIGSYSERQKARHRQATRESQTGTGMFADMEQLAGIIKTLRPSPGEQANQGQNELMGTLMQHAVKSLRPPDPTKTMGQAVDFLKTVREFETARPVPGPRRRRKRRASSKAKRGAAVGQFLGTALFVGADMALRNPQTARRVRDGVATTARRAGGWFQQRTQGGSAPPPSAQANPASDEASMTLDEAIASAKALAQTPVGQCLLQTVREVMPGLAPEELARQGLDGARGWLGANHPLLLRLREDPARVFDEIADIVGLVGDPRWQARDHFLGMMAEGEGEGRAATSQQQAEAGQDAEETVSSQTGGDASVSADAQDDSAEL